MSFSRELLSASEQAAERYKVRCPAPVNCQNWMISDTATTRVRRGLELQVGIIKKRKEWNIGSQRSMWAWPFSSKRLEVASATSSRSLSQGTTYASDKYSRTPARRQRNEEKWARVNESPSLAGGLTVVVTGAEWLSEPDVPVTIKVS